MLLLAGTVAISSMLASGALAKETSSTEGVIPKVATEYQVNMDQLQVELLEKALAPTSAKDAINKWAEAVTTRNGAYQYALFSKELKDQSSAYFKTNGWVTGVSSPWVKEYRIKNEKKISKTKYSFNIEFALATSTGAAGSEVVNVTIKKVNQDWFVDSVNAKESAVIPERTPYQKQHNFTFRAEEYAFEIPLSWDTKYRAEEKDGNLNFFYKPKDVRVSEAILFSIEKIKVATWKDDYEDSLYVKLGEKNGYVYAMLPVSENQYANKPESLEYKEFEKMCMEFGVIKGNFQLIE